MLCTLQEMFWCSLRVCRIFDFERFLILDARNFLKMVAKRIKCICVEELVLIATKFQHELNAVAADTFSGRENDLGWVSWAMSSKPKPSLTRYTDFSVRQTDQRQCQLRMIFNFSLTRMLHLCLSASRLLSLLHSLSVLIFDSGPANWRIIHNFFFYAGFGYAAVGYSLMLISILAVPLT